jgi:hypothetical protein
MLTARPRFSVRDDMLGGCEASYGGNLTTAIERENIVGKTTISVDGLTAYSAKKVAANVAVQYSYVNAYTA